MKGIIRIGDKTTGEGEVLSGSITESGTQGDYIVKSASYEYVVGAAKQVAPMPQLPPVTEYDADSLSSTVFSG